VENIVFITGASSGIGKACAEKFAAAGFPLILLARRKDRLTLIKDRLEKTYPIQVTILTCDVRDREAVSRSIGSLPDQWQGISVLLNNAGLAMGFSTIGEGDPDDWDTMIDTNVKGLLYVSRAVIPFMRTRKTGHIINIGSTAGKNVYPKGNVYCATKQAVDALSKAMRIDLLSDRIRVTAIHPGAAETEFALVRFRGNEQQAKEVYKGYEPLKPEDLAEIIFFCASRPGNVCINDLVVTPLSQADANYFYKQ